MRMTTPEIKKSKAAIVATTIYMILVVASFAVMFLANKDDSLSGIFVILISMPWSFLLTWITGISGIDSMLFNTLFLVLFSLLNATIIYKFISFFSRRSRGT